MTLSIVSDIVKFEKIAILVLARSSSKRVLNKNYRKFHGDKSLVDIKMNVLLDVFPEENVFISSDIRIDNTNVVDRTIESIIDSSLSFTDVITPLYTELYDRGFKHILITYPTSPLFNKEMYSQSIYSYYEHVICGNKTSAVSGYYDAGYYWLDDKEVNYEATASGHSYTQNNKRLFSIDNAVYIKELTDEPKHYMFNRESVHFIEIPKLFGLDIDSKEDFVIAQQLYSAYEKQKFNGVY